MKKYSVNKNFFDKIDSEEKAYWLGFLYADGNINLDKVTLRIIIAEKDREHLFLLKKSLESSHLVREKRVKSAYKNTNLYYELNIYSKKIVDDLNKLGCIPNKSLILKFPTEEQVPRELIPHFIRGYFDGDGTVFFNRRICRGKPYTFLNSGFCGTFEFLSELTKFLIFSETLIPVHKEKRRTSNTWRLGLNSNKRSIGLYNYMYNNSTIFLNRKKEKFEQFIERRSTTIITRPN